MRRRAGSRRELLAIDKVELYTVSFTDNEGIVHDAMVGRIEHLGRPTWFYVPGTRDNLNDVPSKWLADLLESARSTVDDDEGFSTTAESRSDGKAKQI